MFFQMIVTVLLIWLLTQKWNRRHLEKLAGQLKTKLRALPIVGHSYHLMGSGEDIMTAFQLAGRDAIESGGTTALWQFHKLYIMIADPEVAEIILKNCLEKDDIYKLFHQVVGDGSLFSSVSKWRPRRKLMAPIFNMNNLKQFVEVFSEQSCIMVDQFKRITGKGPTSLWKVLSAYTMDSVFGSTLGVNFKAQENPSQPLLVATEDIFKIIGRRTCQPLLYSDFIFKKLPQNRILLKHKAFIDESFDKIIEEKRKSIEESQQLMNGELSDGYRSFVELMLDPKLGLSDMKIREECIVIVGAGTDTSAVAMGYTFVMLARYPGVQEKVYQELSDVIGVLDRPVMAADLPRFKYLDAVIRESMRLYPPVPVIVRKIDRKVRLRLPRFCCESGMFADARTDKFEVIWHKKTASLLRNTILNVIANKHNCPPMWKPATDDDITFSNEVLTHLASGVTLLPGCGAVVNIWAINRNPHYWGEDAEQFLPERFLDSSPKHPAAFMSFSYGPRNCLGYQYAMMSMKTVLATLLMRYRIVPASPDELKHKQLRVKFDVMMRHVDNYCVGIEDRQ